MNKEDIMFIRNHIIDNADRPLSSIVFNEIMKLLEDHSYLQDTIIESYSILSRRDEDSVGIEEASSLIRSACHSAIKNENKLFGVSDDS